MEPVAGKSRPGLFLSAEWRYLLMLNFEVAPQILERYIPAGTTLDLFGGRALVSIVGFRFLRTRVLGTPVPFHRNFDEINLRFYVRRTLADGEVRRAVSFIKELVPRRAIAITAKFAYNEPYLACRMRSRVPAGATDDPGRVEYSWQTASGWHSVAGSARGKAEIPAAGSEAAFITEHYWGYTPQRDGGTLEYQVHHPQWRLWGVENAEVAHPCRC